VGLLRRTGVAAAASAAAFALPLAAVPQAQAAPCSDAEVVFARGTSEAPGVGGIGQTFIDELRTQVGAKSVGVYAVDYPATIDFPTAMAGINDARAHIMATAANCPDTKMVLGGFSQGAAVMGFVTADVVPDGVTVADVPTPMPPEIADHVSAVALFGLPSTRFMHAINQPPVTIGPSYTAKTISVCADNDVICASDGRSWAVHNQYVEDGMADQAVTFVANRLQADWAAQAAMPGAGADTQTPPAATPHLPAAAVTPPGPVV
jgi:cutinase